MPIHFSKIALFIFLVSKNFNAVAEDITICGKIVHGADIRVHVYLPIHNYYNISLLNNNYQNYFATNDSFYLRTDIKSLSAIHVRFHDTESGRFVGASVFYGGPGDSIHVTVDPGIKNSQWIKYSGTNGAGNNQFQKINFVLIDKYEPIHDLLNEYTNQPVHFTARFTAIIDSVLSPFRWLHIRGEITKEYYTGIKKNFLILYIDEVMKRFIHPPVEMLRISKLSRVKLIDSLLYLQPASDNDIKPLYNSLFFLEFYYAFLQFKKRNIESIMELNKEDSAFYYSNRLETVNKNIAHLIDIKNEDDKAAIWAFFMADFIPGLFKLESIHQYDRLFPQSPFTPYLLSKWRSRRRIEDPVYTLQFPVTIIDSTGEMQSFENILQLPELHEKNILVDLWATWCGPCISEFAFNRELDSFLVANGVKKVYVTFDGVNNKARWIKNIEKYKFGGYHIVSSDSLAMNMRQVLGIKASSISIPRYILINKNRTTMTNVILRPSDGDAFYDQVKDSFQLLTKKL